MASDLSKTLVDAATAAVGDTTCEHMAHFGQVDCDACVARAAVAESDYACFHPTRLRGLAAEVKTGEGR